MIVVAIGQLFHEVHIASSTWTEKDFIVSGPTVQTKLP